MRCDDAKLRTRGSRKPWWFPHDHLGLRRGPSHDEWLQYEQRNSRVCCRDLLCGCQGNLQRSGVGFGAVGIVRRREDAKDRRVNIVKKKTTRRRIQSDVRLRWKGEGRGVINSLKFFFFFLMLVSVVLTDGFGSREA